ncbi:coiled-coil domain-containing protein 149 [Belonocnema kinseyi]|uniref:coiled-coil domain-containing protein 149 n=1 Tax=Belonocnema kinseyi TaxID=2817044 RepID=UPI00143D246D|nr:coiled-coil domain-containing protein 149 [Belonocnema kinseyi]
MANIPEAKRNYGIHEDGGYAKDCTIENAMLKKKLQLKTEAVMVLSQELDQCRTQRDQYKLMAEQIQERLVHLRKQTNESLESNSFRTLDSLMETREQNKCLRLQVETLRQKLMDSQTDIKILRKNRTFTEQKDAHLAPDAHQREELIEQLEKLNVKCGQLQTDLQSVLDEKHELEIERDAFKCKAHRLNHELSKALSASKPVDVDSLINENRYLQERLQHLLEEKELARQSLSKYKGMLDSKRLKGTIKLGGNSAAGTVMTHKQVELLLQQGPNIPPQKASAAISDLHCLSAALLEALNDKTLALAHQKKANKILALRICELDSAVQSPTMKLLEGYTGADVDIRCDDFDSDLSTKPWDSEDTSEPDLTKEENVEDCEFSKKEKYSTFIPADLPHNLGALVQKAMDNLKDINKNKS